MTRTNPYPNVWRFLTLAYLACALVLLTACASEPQVKTVTVEVPTPVIQKVPSALTKDCQPRYLYPETDITVQAVLDRLEAVEIALAICRNQLELIKTLSP